MQYQTESERSKKRANLIFVLVSMIIIFCGIMSFFYSNQGPAINIVSSTASPDGKFEAVVFTTNPDPTVSTTYNVSIIRQEQVIDSEHTVLSVNRMKPDKPIRVTWKPGRTLLVQYPPECELLSSKVRDIVGGTTFQIKFENLPNKP